MDLSGQACNDGLAVIAEYGLFNAGSLIDAARFRDDAVARESL
jgi:hypothetical protein